MWLGIFVRESVFGHSFTGKALHLATPDKLILFVFLLQTG